MPPHADTRAAAAAAFGYRDGARGKWTKARYRAEHHVIAQRFRGTEWRIEGPPERRWPLGEAFSPWRR